MEYAWILSKFGGDLRRARERYRGYIGEGLKERSGEALLNSVQGQVILGGEGFVKKVKKQVEGRKDCSNHSPQRNISRRRLKAKRCRNSGLQAGERLTVLALLDIL